MKAMVLHHRDPGGVALSEMPRPDCPPGWARVRMIAASVNRVDLYMRDSGAGITHSLPLIMGVDGVGEVIEAPDCNGLAPGDRVILYPYEFCGRCRPCLRGDQPLCIHAKVLGEHRHGTFAEEVALPARSLLRLSDRADADQAAVLGVAYLTAWRMLFGKVAAGPGWTVLVQGAGGGVAHAAVELAQMAGLRVIVTTGTDEKLRHFRAMGVEAIDYRHADTPAEVARLTRDEGVDLVLDTVGAKTWPTSLRSLARGGHLVTCGATTGAHPSADLQRMFIRQLSVQGSTLGSIEEFRRLIAAWEAGQFTPHIDRTFSLEEVPQAFEHLENPARLGKILIRIA